MKIALKSSFVQIYISIEREREEEENMPRKLKMLKRWIRVYQPTSLFRWRITCNSSRLQNVTHLICINIMRLNYEFKLYVK